MSCREQRMHATRQHHATARPRDSALLRRTEANDTSTIFAAVRMPHGPANTRCAKRGTLQRRPPGIPRGKLSASAIGAPGLQRKTFSSDDGTVEAGPDKRTLSGEGGNAAAARPKVNESMPSGSLGLEARHRRTRCGPMTLQAISARVAPMTWIDLQR